MHANVEAVREAPIPTNVSELKAFLGMVNYYHSFLPNVSTVTVQLHNLLRKGIKWEWSPEFDQAFRMLKYMLCEAPLLIHFNP